jgi:hypothetical protein
MTEDPFVCERKPWFFRCQLNSQLAEKSNYGWLASPQPSCVLPHHLGQPTCKVVRDPVFTGSKVFSSGGVVGLCPSALNVQNFIGQSLLWKFLKASHKRRYSQALDFQLSVGHLN